MVLTVVVDDIGVILNAGAAGVEPPYLTELAVVDSIDFAGLLKVDIAEHVVANVRW